MIERSDGKIIRADRETARTLDPNVAELGEVVWIVDLNRQSLDRVVPSPATLDYKKLENKKDKVVLIKADEEVEYSAVMAAMDQLRQAGIEDIGLITEPKEKPGTTAGGK